MPYAELSGLVLGTGIATALICVLLYQIVQHDEFRRYHEVGYAVFLQSELPLLRSVRARVAG